MIELIPTLLAQKPLKQAEIPVQPIEPSSLTQSQSTAPAVAPDPAIAIPEAVFVPVTATPSPTAKPGAQKPAVASKVTLPKIPQARTSRSTAQPTQQAVNSQTVPQNQFVNPSSSAATPVKLTAEPAPSFASPSTNGTNVAPRASTSIEIPVPKPMTTGSEASRSSASSSIEIPAPKATNPIQPEASQSAPSDRIESPTPRPTAQTAPLSPTQEQKQLLEQRLADIVSKDRAAKQAAQRDTLIARAYSFATQRRFDQARRLLQDPTIPAEVRDQVLSNINSLEASSRAIGVTPIKAPPVQSNSGIAGRSPTKVSRSIPIRVSRPQQTISIQVPTAIDSLPIQQKPSTSDLTAPIASDAATSYSGQIVNPKDLQAFNRNLPKLDSANQIVYPLPEPVPVTSRFGWRRHPVTGAQRFHAGVDLGAGQGTPVIASQGGKVKIADRLGGYGLAIVLQKPNGAQDTLYAHLSQILVRPGETIQPGAIIGRVGSTGLSTGPHLHYEARRKTNSGWVAVDPGGQLEAARVRLVQARRIEAQSSSNRGG